MSTTKRTLTQKAQSVSSKQEEPGAGASFPYIDDWEKRGTEIVDCYGPFAVVEAAIRGKTVRWMAHGMDKQCKAVRMVSEILSDAKHAQACEKALKELRGSKKPSLQSLTKAQLIEALKETMK